MNSKEINLNNVWGEATVYKGVNIYPVKLKNALKFYQYASCLTIDKNTIPDPQVIRMSYLDFIIALSQQEECKVLNENLINLLLLVLQEQKFNIVPDEQSKKFIIRVLNNIKDIDLYDKLYKEYEVLIKKVEDNNIKENEIENLYELKNHLDYLMLNNTVTLTGKDFDKIRKIILKQNMVKFDDELVNAEVKQALQEAQDFINKKNGDKQATLEELIFSYGCDICNGKPQDYKDIKELTIYQFYKGLQRKSLSKQQMMLSTALGMGALSPKDIPDWLNHMPENGMYDDVILTDEERTELEKLDKKSK